MNRLCKSVVLLCSLVSVGLFIGCGPTEAEAVADSPPLEESLPVQGAADCRDTGCSGSSYCCYSSSANLYGCYGFGHTCQSYLCQDPRYNKNYHCWEGWCVPNGLTCTLSQ